MISNEEINYSTLFFLKNPHWKRYYEEAPTDECKRYIAYGFANSMPDVDDEDLVNAMNEIEDNLKLEDWKHLYRYCGNNPFKGKCARKIAELGGDPKDLVLAEDRR